MYIDLLKQHIILNGASRYLINNIFNVLQVDEIFLQERAFQFYFPVASSLRAVSKTRRPRAFDQEPRPFLGRKKSFLPF